MRKSKFLRKYFIMSLAILSVFIFVWFIYAYLSIGALDKFLNLSGADALKLMFSTGGGYELPQTIIVLLFVFLLPLNYLLSSENVPELVRQKSRAKFAMKYFANIVFFSIIFGVLKEGVNLVGVIIFFDMEAIKSLRIIPFSCFTMITLSLFYIKTGLFLFLIRSFVNAKIAPVYLFIIYFIEYFVISTHFRVWSPFMDAAIISKLVDGETQISDNYFLIIRAIIFIIIFAIAGFMLFRKKDLLINEKQ